MKGLKKEITSLCDEEFKTDFSSAYYHIPWLENQVSLCPVRNVPVPLLVIIDTSKQAKMSLLPLVQ